MTNFQFNINTAQLQPRVLDQLRTKHFVSTTLDGMFGSRNITSLEEWEAFSNSWNRLELDRYMNDGGKYRFRRFSRFRYELKGDSLVLKPHAPYSQPKYLNPLNGGMLRYFEPILEETVRNKLFRDILTSIGRTLAELDREERWDLNVYQNRIVASPGQIGKPVPEGMHRDGVRFSVLLAIKRTNVEGAENIILDNNKIPVFRRTLENAGDVILFCDDLLYHDATPIRPKDGVGDAARDLLVVEYFRPEILQSQSNPN